MTYREKIAANVRAEIGRADLTQKAVSKIIGLSTAAVSERLKAKVDFKPEELKILADYLGIDPVIFYRSQVVKQEVAP